MYILIADQILQPYIYYQILNHLQLKYIGKRDVYKRKNLQWCFILL